ncbi:hypothetical protein BJ944DRAFT_240371 [Cunninghamella echinulata]|nr:hypothetical protein BJ944DRAFT_240371 [Cunninghamella echinulata]
MFKPTPEHSFFIRALYKRILSEASYFFDDRARTFMINRAKRIFDEYKSCNDIHRIKVKITDARKKLHQIERANRGDKKSVMRILEAAYGRTGRIKHKLMHSYLYENIPADMVKPSPLIPHIPHTAPPPPLCYPLRTIVTKVLKKPLTPNLPTSPFKPLHRGRQANILWRYRSSLIKNITIPLPFEIGCELERKAGADIHHPSYAGQPSCQRGGPLWKDMYAGKEQTHDIEFLHLYPHAKLYPLTSPSFQRILPLPPSPFTLPHSLFATRTLIQQSPMDQTIYLTTKSKVPDRPRISYSDRKIQRFYRSLLSDIPFLHPLPTAISLYDSRIKYSLDTSQWAIGKPTKILDLDRMPESLRIQYSK